MKTKDVRQVDAQTLKQWLYDGAEIALLDVREAGQFGEEHLLLAIPLAYSRLEIDVARLVPRLATRIVLVDETGTDVALLAHKRLSDLGYTEVHVLQGGVQGWSKAGLELFAGVNVPSKVFGEMVEHHFETPHVSATQLNEWIEQGRDMVVLDGRTLQEFHKMSIPSATCCPNGELALHIDDLVKSDSTEIVINCAGRTRSIIGAQTLINLGVPNPVYALENGTQGWYLQDFTLNHGEKAQPLQVESEQAIKARAQRAAKLADRFDIKRIDAETLSSWWQDDGRTTYLCDVRTPEEFKANPIPGAQSTPGGQFVQATDQYIATRGARVVLVDGDAVRAPVTATWLHMLGWDVSVLMPQEIAAWKQRHAKQVGTAGKEISVPQRIDAAKLQALTAQGARLIDVRDSMQYRENHLVGADWSIRPLLAQYIEGLAKKPTEVVLVASEPEVAGLAAIELRELGVQSVYVFLDDPAQWHKAGLKTQATPDIPADKDCIDYLFFVHDRHDGNKEAARQYLRWELDLMAQLDDQEKSMFRLPVS